MQKINNMDSSNYPILKLLLPLSLGIVLAYFLVNPYLPSHGWRYVLFAEIISGVVVIALTFVRQYRWRLVKSFMLSFVFIMLGLLLTQYHLRQPFNREERQLLSKNRYWLVRILDFPTQRANSVKTLVELRQTVDGKSIRGKVLLYLTKTPAALSLDYGDILLVETSLTEIAAPKNPDAFNMQRYMRRRGIFYSGYVGAQSWQKIGREEANRVKAFSGHLQKRLTAIFVRCGLSGDEYSIIAAILLGDDDTMEPELKAGYAAAGVSHVLCVSGMHVGIIYMILNFLFKPLDLFRTTMKGKTLLILLLIWQYACLTGLSPSVTRSAVMFSFVTVGSLFRRNTNIFHSLFASLFILLIINPLLLFEVGFQLSYIAVFGIVILQKPISHIYACKTRIGRYFWELTTVSISAQIATFPISIYYFGQFPNYFILSNLSVILLSFTVMITGIALIVVSFVKVIVPPVASLLTHEIRLMNGIIQFIRQLPGAVTQDIVYSSLQVILLYGFIVTLYLTLSRRRKSTGWMACGFFTLFSMCFLIKKIEILHQKEAVVYSIRKASAIGFHYRGQGILFSDSIKNRENRNYRFAIRNHERKQHIHSILIPIDTPQYAGHFLCKRGNFIQFLEQRYYLLKRQDRIYETGNKFPVDVLILQYNPAMQPEDVYRILPFRKVIADDTNTPFYLQRWRNYCKSTGIEFHYTGE